MDMSPFLPEWAAMDTAAHVAEIAEQGYTIVEDAIEPELVDALHDDLDRLERYLDIEPATNSFEGQQTLAHLQPARRTASSTSGPGAPDVLPVVEGVLDRGCLISSLSSIAIRPGEIAQPIHADDQLIPLPKPHPPTVCNSMWALTDFTEANGATRLVPGRTCATTARLRQRLRLDRRPRCAKGSVLVWHGSLWHGGGANTHRRAPRRASR